MSTITEIPSDQIIKGKKLDSGGFSDVFFGNWKGRSVAIKELREIDQAQFDKEANLHSALKHPNIVLMHGIIAKTQHFVFAFIANGSLHDLIKTQSTAGWSKTLRLNICKDMTKGLVYLHSQNVIHRDLKSPNILIDDQFRALIGDFGLSKLTTHQSTTQTGGLGSIKWMAPEQFDSGHYKTSVDIYAMGLVLWEVFEEKEPFEGLGLGQIVSKKHSLNTGEIPTEKTPENLHKLLESCWDEATKRPTAEEILKFFDDLPRELENKVAMEEAIKKGDLETLKKPVDLEKKAQALQLAPKVQSQTSVRAIAFGAADWNTFFGDIGVEPPLPSNIEAFLEGPCPFWPDKKVKDTHFLCLIPKTVDGVALTLDSLQDLVKNPKQGAPTKYSLYSDVVKKEHGSKPVEQSHWVLMTKDVILDYLDYIDSLEKVSNYELPPVLEAAVAIFMHTYKTGDYIYKDNKLGPKLTHTRCLEKVNKGKKTVTVGDFSAGGLRISESNFDYSRGVAGFLNLCADGRRNYAGRTNIIDSRGSVYGLPKHNVTPPIRLAKGSAAFPRRTPNGGFRM